MLVSALPHSRYAVCIVSDCVPHDQREKIDLASIIYHKNPFI